MRVSPSSRSWTRQENSDGSRVELGWGLSQDLWNLGLLVFVSLFSHLTTLISVMLQKDWTWGRRCEF